MATKVVHLGDEYIDTELPMSRAPVYPICTVTRAHMAILGNSLVLRNRLYIPVFLTICIVAAYHLTDIYRFWQKVEMVHLEQVEGEKVKRGDQYFLETEEIEDLTVHYQIDVRDDISLSEVLSMRYQTPSNPIYPQFLKLAYIDVASALVYLIGVPFLLIKIIGFRRVAPLYFDRERRIVCTWRLGKAWVQHYQELTFYMSRRALFFDLYSIDANKNLKKESFAVNPSGHLFFNDRADYKPVLSAIVQFMKKGIDRIWNDDWSRQEGFMLLTDKMPDDFYEQVDILLEKLGKR